MYGRTRLVVGWIFSPDAKSECVGLWDVYCVVATMIVYRGREESRLGD